MHRQLTSFEIYVIVSELQDLVGSKIDKTYQLTQNELLIRLKNIKTKQKENIFIRNGELICITNKDFKIPLKPSVFAMTLRKYLQNGKIVEVTQHEFDRIIKFKVSRKEGDYSLYIELFSTGNIILVDPNGKIILPFIKQTWEHRSIRGKKIYIPPPTQINPLNLTKEKFKELLKASDTDIVRTLAVSVNLSGLIAEEICARTNINKNIKIKDVTDEIISKLFDTLTDFLKFFKEKKFTPIIVRKNTELVDIIPIKFISYNNLDFEYISSFTRSLENFIEVKKLAIKTENETEKLIGKLNRQLLQQQEAVKKLKTEIDSKKFEGDLIYLNYQIIDNLLKDISENKSLNINKYEIVKEFNPTKNLLIINLKDVDGKIFETKINYRKSISENAEKSYNEVKKLRSKLDGAEKSIKKTLQQIEQLNIKKIKEKEHEEIISKKKDKIFWFEKFRWFISSDRNIVIAGKDAKTNEFLVKKYLKQGDRYAHADVQGAPSVVIKNKSLDDEELVISDKTLEEACIFAASYSKAWKQFAEAQVYWVLPEQVSKTPQSGEFVPKGAFIIRGKRNYYRCKLELAIGKIDLQGYKKIMAGPINSIIKISEKYVIITPGQNKKIDIARVLSKALGVNVDEVDRVLPPGGINIVKTVGFEL
jgi:predicted ribosome quality control (RQC) complex YloA/Tae2 family protein